MGLIRSVLVVIVSIILFLSLIAGNLFWTIDKSLEYENIEQKILPEISEILKNQMNISNNLNQKLPKIKEYCQNQTNDTNKYTLNNNSILSKEFNLSCEDINFDKPNSTDMILEEILKNKFQEIYYKNYDCKLFDCLKQQPLVLISKYSQNYWKGLFIKNIWILIILLGILFLLVEKKLNMPIITSSLMILSAIPFFNFDLILNILAKPLILSEKIFLENTQLITQITESLFKIISISAFQIALYLLIISILILIFTIPLKIWKATIGKNQSLISPEFKEKIKNLFKRKNKSNIQQT